MAGSVADFDIILAGGGLANGLLALVLTAERPDLRLLLIDAGDRLGGDHTWSFHGTDVDVGDLELLSPMVRSSWADQRVVFPAHSRTLSTSYHSINSANFDAHLRNRLDANTVQLGTQIRTVANGHVELLGGQRLNATCVIDGRGWQGIDQTDLGLAYQKFVGHEVETKEPHGLKQPVIMDATVSQVDGYRFVYCLPYTPTRLLIEDTYYSDRPDLDVSILADRIAQYAFSKGWEVTVCEREEKGVLPIVLAGTADAFFETTGGVPRSGLRAGLFHPTTGYSLPDAVRLARTVATAPQMTSEAIGRLVEDMTRKIWRQRSFHRLLNRMMFAAAEGEQRRAILERFYRLPQGLIERFYAGQTTTWDKARILSGKPPVSFMRAMAALPSHSGIEFARRNAQSSSEKKHPVGITDHE